MIHYEPLYGGLGFFFLKKGNCLQPGQPSAQPVPWAVVSGCEMRTWAGAGLTVLPPRVPTVISSSLSTDRCSKVLVGCISPSTSEMACQGLAVAPAGAALVGFLCPTVL